MWNWIITEFSTCSCRKSILQMFTQPMNEAMSGRNPVCEDYASNLGRWENMIGFAVSC